MKITEALAMRLPRMRFTIGRTMVVVLVVSPIFAWLPWPLSAILAGAIVPSLLFEEWTLIGCVAYSLIAGVLISLLLPPIVIHQRKAIIPPSAAGPAAGPSLAETRFDSARTVDRPVAAPGRFVFSPDHRSLAIAEQDASIRLVDFRTGATTGILVGHTKPANSLAYTPDNRFLVSGSYSDKNLRVWDLEARRQLLQVSGSPCFSLAISKDGRTVVSGHGDPKFTGLILWDLSPRGELSVRKKIGDYENHNIADSQYNLRFSRDGRWVVSGSFKMYIMEVSTGSVRQYPAFGGRGDRIFDFEFLSDKGWVVEGNTSGNLVARELLTGEVKFSMPINLCGETPARNFSISRLPGTQIILAASEYGTVTWHDFDRSNHPAIRVSPKNAFGVRYYARLALSDDGEGLARSSAEGVVYLLDKADYSPLSRPAP